MSPLIMSPQSTIAHYRIIGKLGEGGMGEVYRATDTKLNRDVAIKVLPEAFSQDPDRMRRFAREAQVLAALNHPNIAAIHGVEERALIMELVDGETLQGPLPLDTALDYARQIADALEYAHEKGIVHRDLKPANIKVTPDGVVKVLDFGLAKALGGESKSGDPNSSPTLTMRATQIGVIMGTAGYMAPEQAKGKPVDRRADIWAFGVVLWEMLTGRALFEGETVSDVMAQVLTKELNLTQVPNQVQRLLRSCLQKDPKQRLKSIGDWRLLLDEPSVALPGALRSNRVLWLIAAAGLALAIASGWAWMRRTPPRAIASYVLDVSPPDGESLYQDAINGIQAISPDGRLLAFIAESKSSRRIWVRPLDSPMARSLAGTELADGLFWSPDSRHLGFAAGTRLHRVEIATGVIRDICDGGSSIRGASWNAAGTIVFGTAGLRLQRVSADGGRPAPVVEFGQATAHWWPRFLPDGKRFLYWERSVELEGSGIYAGSVDLAPNQQSHTLILATPHMALHAAPGHLLFLRGKTLFAQPFDTERLLVLGTPRAIAENVGSRASLPQFGVSENGVLTTSPAGSFLRSVTVVSREGAVLETIGKPGAYNTIQISPDGRSAAMLITDGSRSTSDIWLMHMARGVLVRFTHSAVSINPLWSPDGKEIIYSSNRGDYYQIFRKPVAGGLPEQSVHPEIRGIAGSWLTNPDAVLYRDLNANSISLLPLVPGSKPIPIETTTTTTHGPTSSPSGKWLAFTSAESGNLEIYVKAIPIPGDVPGPKVRVSSAGGTNPAWSADGNELFFNTLDDRLMAAPVKYPGGRFEAGEPKQLFALGGTSVYNGGIYWQPIGNGQRFVVLRSEPVASKDNRINVRINWQAGLQTNP